MTSGSYHWVKRVLDTLIPRETADYQRGRFRCYSRGKPGNRRVEWRGSVVLGNFDGYVQELCRGCSRVRKAAFTGNRLPCHSCGWQSPTGCRLNKKACDEQSGQFRETLGRFARDLLLGEIPEAEIEAEAAAQIRHLQAAGVTVTHVDTHKHAHVFPGVYRPLLRAARSCGVPAIRNPFEPDWSLAVTRGASGLRRLQVRMLRSMRRDFLRQ